MTRARTKTARKPKPLLLGTALKKSLKKFQKQRKESRDRKAGKAKRGNKWVFAKRVKIPQRQMVPEGKWPDSWAKAFDEAADAAIRKFFK